ncbi:MAG TPA: AbrB/MazE/SpoVT family DNA-binding domain-containing protein [Pseudonocardiaceae bacterium]|nr:AbrB/MazE/SpoVT family DNA-binding domain-containing protein [Pseudonocardiaceae bacterium]
MTDQLVAPVIPSSTSTSRTPFHASGGSRAAHALPLATPAAPPTAPPQDVVYGMGRIDASGRIGDRTVTHALGWRPGDRLTLTATRGVVLAHRDPAGMVTLTTKPYVTIPAVLRERCGLHAGERVLLAAAPGADTLAVYPLACLDQAIRAHQHRAAGDEGQP